MRILAIDIGEKRIGVSISDELGIYAHPFQTLIFKGINSLIESLKKIIDSKNITELVIGIPYTLKGTLSDKTKEVLKIKQEIADKIDLPIHEIDERFTTKLVEQALQNIGKKPSKNRDIIDQIAAVNILQTYLDSKDKSIY